MSDFRDVTFGEHLFSRIDDNVYLQKLYHNILINYSRRLFHLDEMEEQPVNIGDTGHRKTHPRRTGLPRNQRLETRSGLLRDAGIPQQTGCGVQMAHLRKSNSRSRRRKKLYQTDMVYRSPNPMDAGTWTQLHHRTKHR